jgi:uncharacterized protein (DUF983 family)
VPPGDVGPVRTVVRGAAGRCGRCGARGIFAGYFRLRDRCPRCGYRFVREEGAFTGVLLLNITVTFSLMFVAFVAYVIWRGVTGEQASIVPFAAVGIAVGVVVPVAFYPIAGSTWAALDLVMRPLDVDEELDAWNHAVADPPDRPSST